MSGAAVILGNTEEAMEDLAAQIERLKGEGGREVGGCWGVRINSGRFGVGWESTREVLERGRVDVVVVRPEYEEGEEGEEEGKDVSVPGRAVGKGRGVKRMAESADDGDGKSSKAAKRPTPFLRG